MKERYFHGGNRKLHVNDYLQPPAETGAEVMGGWNNPLCRKDRVYLTTNLVDARYYASASPNPIVYEAIPEEIEQDPDCPTPGYSIACTKARIIAIHKIPGKVIKKNRKLLRRPNPPVAGDN